MQRRGYQGRSLGGHHDGTDSAGGIDDATMRAADRIILVCGISGAGKSTLIAEADYVVEVGPAGGAAGGKIIYQGAAQGLLTCNDNPTGLYLLAILPQSLAAIER